MHTIFKSPYTKEKLSVDNSTLVSVKKDSFKIINNNLINFLEINNQNAETDKAASFRWSHSQRLESDNGFVDHQINDFLLRYGFKNLNEYKSYLINVKTVAEIGAGEGRMVDWFLKFSNATIYALELSDSVYYLSEKYKGNDRVVVIKADALNHPFSEGSIDFLSCEQCIHHTDNPGEIFASLCKAVSPKGKAILSVYAKKSPVREKFDRIIRDSIAKLPSEKKYDLSKQITEISKILSEMDVNVEIPESYMEFGHLAGEKMTLQRFFYFGVMKCFWNKDFTFEKSLEFNHDWYSYPICNTTSLDDATKWFISNGFNIEHIDSNLSNLNIRGSLK